MPVDGQKLLVDGNGAQLPYDGTIQHSQYVVNTDLWTPIKTLNFTLVRIIPRLRRGIRSVSLRFASVSQTLVYTDSTQTLPENFCPAMALGWCAVDGSAGNPALTPVMAYSQSFFTYTDE